MVARAQHSFLDDPVPLPRRFLRLPLELRIPEGFRADAPATWPRVDGRLEYVKGRLLYMPPCGEIQGCICTGVTAVLARWAHSRPEFGVRSNEPGMTLGGEIRAADQAVWRRPPGTVAEPGFSHEPPILAVEVSGAEEDEAALGDKARWYLDRGVEVVWLVLHEPRAVVVLTRDGERRYAPGDRIEPHASLPDLVPTVDEFFVHLR